MAGARRPWRGARSGPRKPDDEKAAALFALNRELGRGYTLDDLPDQPRDPWDSGVTGQHRRWWDERIARQKEIDASIAAKAEFEYLYDRPYEDRKVVRTAGPFTVESLSPHRTLGVDENDEVMDRAAETRGYYGREPEFVPMILENLRTTGVQQAHKEDRLAFTSVAPWPGRFVCAEGRYVEGDGKDDEDDTSTPRSGPRSSSAPSSARYLAPGSRGRNARSRRGPIRRARRLCVQLRRTLVGVRRPSPEISPSESRGLILASEGL